MKAGFFVLIYAIFVLIGGIIGYIKAASIVSLATGIIASLALVLSAYAMITNRVQGFYASLCISAFLCIFFVYRFIVTAKFMPGGLMAIFSLMAVIALILGGIPKKFNNGSF